MRNCLFIEPLYGASGDMLLAAFVDAGMPVAFLKKKLQSICPVDFDIKLENVKDGALCAKRLTFIFRDAKKKRVLADIRAIIKNSKLSEFVKSSAIEAFYTLAEVEGKIHGVPVDSVHFHELGGIDTLLDIAGYFIALEFYEIRDIYVSDIPIGHGRFKGEHGIMPVPAYSTLEFLKKLSVYGLDITKENITPTAALLMAMTAKHSMFPEMVPEQTGYGTGNFKFKGYTNLTRLTIGHRVTEMRKNDIYVLEFLLDDMTPELIGNLIEVFLSNGALDCYFTPVHMKKNRPGTLVTVLAPVELFNVLTEMVFSESSTIGVRYRLEDRLVLERKNEKIRTSLGTINVKTHYFSGKKYMKPEYDDVKKLSMNKKLPLKEVYSIIIKEMHKLL